MTLKSKNMALSQTELKWLPWFGANGAFSLFKSCYLNRDTYQNVEKTFEGIANTRVKLLNTWVNNQWSQLEVLLELVSENFPNVELSALEERLNIVKDVSEYFVINPEGEVIQSTEKSRIGSKDLSSRAVSKGLEDYFLHGPYVDSNTLKIGPSSSKFHDAVSLMFYLPIKHNGKSLGAICARVPNDVLGDLIQREAGHIYKESGDNYLFMVKSVFDSNTLPGTALSRSRFEDNTFSHGENLKSGVNTRWGQVKVERHTEFEIRFTDPATKELHPGVRETIKRGENLFVTYPGYSDYRHIPVIGKGVTFQLKGSPDTWGMMCEGDLEEVYRRRSINIKLMKSFLLSASTPLSIHLGLHHFTDLSATSTSIIAFLSLILTCLSFNHFSSKKISRNMTQMTEVIQTVAEGEGNLQQRLDGELSNDETGDLGRWMNSFIDNLDNTIGNVISASNNVKNSNNFMAHTNEEAKSASHYLASTVENMLDMFQRQVNEVESASQTANQLKQTMDKVVEKAKQRLIEAKTGTQEIRNVVKTTAESVQSLDHKTNEIAGIITTISDITNQTNLLALNAAIEAARAGEHGRGFSVVADEVRSLALKTAEAAEEIQTMLEGIQEETRNAVSFMEKGAANVDRNLQVNEKSGDEDNVLYELVDSLFEAMHLLNEGNKTNSNTAHEMSVATEQMKRSIADLQRRSSRMGLSALKLNSLVGQFQVSSKA
ncbi:methyl-accepting chemotaxis protein [Marinomonas mediterranea]|uniref:methyl-accepting chemotaxis protein n=1 Tax=Marinomonas mediterranea TaxID=119864 RepID=UPI00234976CD|nr:methyl-accepting chemotaxis protein [Marinomonas mediterranea]WCN08721.1 HAMP domain-containing protein [Marinomonas mediterranea]WCN12769.1 HAMP domain-containing protein [Marinomonas mediterranea]